MNKEKGERKNVNTKNNYTEEELKEWKEWAEKWSKNGRNQKKKIR